MPESPKHFKTRVLTPTSAALPLYRLFVLSFAGELVEEEDEEKEEEVVPVVLSGLGYGNAAQLTGEAWEQPAALVKAFDRRHKADPGAVADPLKWPKPKQQQAPNCAVSMGAGALAGKGDENLFPWTGALCIA